MYDERADGVALLERGMDPIAPDTETAVVGTQIEPAETPTGQQERPVDIMKVGGKTLGYELYAKGEVDGFELNDLTFETVGSEVAEDSGDIAIVTSAAIMAGMQAVGLRQRPDKDTDMRELQRLSDIGRRYIENKWDEFLPGRHVGGLPLTRRELDHPQTREETLGVIERHFVRGDVPVINENDAITHEEISFGSNDILAARLAARMQQSDLFGTVRLFLLTDVNGVYRDVNNLYSRISVIENTDEYRHLAGGADSNYSIGGMKSKFEAADIAKKAGVDMWIYSPGHGHREQAVEGEIGTYFPAAA
jgi:glutamate 5-kinase